MLCTVGIWRIRVKGRPHHPAGFPMRFGSLADEIQARPQNEIALGAFPEKMALIRPQTTCSFPHQ